MGVDIDLGGQDQSGPASEEPQKIDKASEAVSNTNSAGGSNVPAFMMTGKKAHDTMAQEEAMAKARQEEAGKLWRFYIRKEDIGEDFTVTFLDGNLDENGLLIMPTWYEHMIQLNGRWENFPCVSANEPCPMCESGNNHALVGGFTVIDHTPYTIKKGPKEGQVIEKSKKLFIAKRTTLGQLQKIASKRGGLTGVTLEISRSTNKSASVGDMFDVIKEQTLEEVRADVVNGGYKPELAEPANWAEEIVYRDRAALEELGVVGSTSMVGGDAPSKDLAGQL